MTAPADRAALVEVMARAHPSCSTNPPKHQLNHCLEDAARVLTAIEAAGCAVVPVKVTEKMQIAAQEQGRLSVSPELKIEVGRVFRQIQADYRAMLAYSPYRKGDGG